jgi:osmoprotectant transport system permease protein
MATLTSPASVNGSWRSRVDRLGVLVLVLVATGFALPFVSFRANRIVPGEPVGFFSALPLWAALTSGIVLAAVAMIGVLRFEPRIRMVASLVALLVLALALGIATDGLTPEGNRIARIAPGAGLWTLLLGFGLMASDAVSRQQLGPLARIGLLGVVTAGIGAVLLSGIWSDLSVMREYANRAPEFWREAGVHVMLALGSLVAAALVGIPIGIVCDRVPALRAPVVNTLNAVQTIPSIALFGLLIAPLAWVAATIPGAAQLGIAGIGAAPAILALFLYSLLPVVANTIAGLAAVPPAAEEAARGMGMTDRERLFEVDLPLAFPVILTGIRIVLVQNIGLATVSSLIGGGGLGVFVFQGVGQTAMDLVLLGAVPTVALAFAAAVILDAIVELSSPGARR